MRCPPDSPAWIRWRSYLPRRLRGLATKPSSPRTSLTPSPELVTIAARPEPHSPRRPRPLPALAWAALGPQPGRERPEHLGQPREPGHHPSRSAALLARTAQVTVPADSLSHGGSEGFESPRLFVMSGAGRTGRIEDGDLLTVLVQRHGPPWSVRIARWGRAMVEQRHSRPASPAGRPGRLRPRPPPAGQPDLERRTLADLAGPLLG